jgi:probable phosphoglycerate mutase
MGRLVAELVASEPGADWRLVSSPIGRARDTAQAVAAATGLSIELDARLAEICCGAWEGRLWDDVRRDDPHRAYSGERFFGAPGGESFEQVIGRAQDWLRSLPPEGDRRVVAVSHGVLGRLLRGAYAGLDRAAMLEQAAPQDAVFRLQNGQIDRFDCEPVDS